MTSNDDKKEFYNNFGDHLDMLEQVKTHTTHLYVGDFYTRVGSDSHLKHLEVVARHCSYDTTNKNGENMCEEHRLRLA